MTKLKESSGRKKKNGIGNYVISLVLFTYLLLIVIPYIYSLFASLSTYKEYYFNLFPIPKSGLRWENYSDAWNNLKHDGTGIPAMIINSLWFSGGSAFLGVFFGACSAYICAKYKFFGRGFIYMFALISMMVPIVGSMPSQLKYVSMLGGYNSYLFVLIMSTGIGGGYIILYSCFKNVDWGYAEAAFIDGAGHFRVFFEVMLPQVISPMIALFLSDFIIAWANAENSLVFYPELPTLTTGLYYFRTYVVTAVGMQRYPAYFAALLLCMLPTVILFAIFQEKLMDIQIEGGLKG